MIISKVDAFHVQLPITLGGENLADTDNWSIRDITSFNHVLVRIQTEDGLVGWGEAFAFKGGEALIEVINKMLKPALLGADASDVEGINHRLQLENHLWGRYGLTMFAISSVDIALWDLAAKRAHKPLYELLGGKQNSISAYASLVRYGNAQVAADLSVRAVEEGYRYIKLHEVEPSVISAVREAIGSEIGLMTDTNCAWDEAQAIAAARQMQSLNLMMIEEPTFPPEDFAALARIGKAGGVPIAAGECACTAFEFKQMLEAKAVSFIQPSVAKVGGISEFLNVNRLAADYDVSIMPHSPYHGPGYLATLHLLSALQPNSLLEHLYVGKVHAELYGEQAWPKQGQVMPSSAPGLGLEPDMAVIEEFSA